MKLFRPADRQSPFRKNVKRWEGLIAFGGRRPRARAAGGGDGSSFLGLARPLGAWFALALKLSEQPFRFICWEHAANLARRQQRHLVGGELVAVLVWP
jgi:hypothetical protein